MGRNGKGYIGNGPGTSRKASGQRCAWLRNGINSTRLIFSLKSETERKERGGDKASEKS